MRFPERHPRIAGSGCTGRRGHRYRFARADRGSERDAREAVVPERHVLRETLRVRERRLLVRRLQRRDVAGLELERVEVRGKLGGEVPPGEVEAGGEPDVPAETGGGVAVQIETALAPGARDDERLDEVALHAVEIGGLVVLVDEAEGHEEQPGPYRRGVIEPAIHVELLHFELTD